MAGGGRDPAVSGRAAGRRRAILAQGGMDESGRQREGSRGARHPPRRAGSRSRPRAPVAGRVEREHRHRLRDAGCCCRHRGDDLSSRQRESGAPRAARSVRRRGGGHRSTRGDRGRGAAGSRAGGGASRPVLLRGPVRQPGESQGASRDDRARDLVADRRPAHPLRRRDGHHGNHDGNRWLPEGAQRRHHPRGRAARLAVSRARGAQASRHDHAASGAVRSEGAGCRRRDRHGDRRPDGPLAGPERRVPGGLVGRRGRGRGDRHPPPRCPRPRRGHRVRHGEPVSQRAAPLGGP